MSTAKFFSLFLLLLLALGSSTTASAGIQNNEQIFLIKPGESHTAPPFSKTNSTFRSDHQSLSANLHRALIKEDLRREKLVEVLQSRWYKAHLAVIPTQSQQISNGESPSTNPNSTAKPNGNNLKKNQQPDSTAFQWKAAFSQAFTFLWIEHAFRFATEPGTRDEMRGPFFKDWFNSIRRTRGWRDGDPFIVNYVGHPMQGSVTNYIYIHNDPKSVKLEAGFNKAYFKSRLKAMLFSTVYSTQFELGPISEASLGNVGMFPSKTSRHPSAFVDLVVTPTLGTVWMMGEDTLDRLVVKRMENHVDNRLVRLLVRGFLNPSHSFANILRGKYPWHRDGRRL